MGTSFLGTFLWRNGVKYIVRLTANKTGSLCGVDGLYNRCTVTVKLLFSPE